jgi:hypothetical protein
VVAAMRGTPDTFWTPFDPDVYLDARRTAWAAVEARWVRYVSRAAGGAVIYVHAREARDVVEVLRGRELVATRDACAHQGRER